MRRNIIHEKIIHINGDLAYSYQLVYRRKYNKYTIFMEAFKHTFDDFFNKGHCDKIDCSGFIPIKTTAAIFENEEDDSFIKECIQKMENFILTL